MGTPPVPDEILRQTYQSFIENDSNQSKTAKALGISRESVQRRVRQYLERSGDLSKEPSEEPKPEPTRAEIFDAGFWKKKYHQLEKSLGEAEHLAAELAGLRGVSFDIPDWIMSARSGKRGKSVIGALTSDIHMGEVITAEEINGINAFNPEICRARLRRYFPAVCEIGSRWASDTDCEGALLALAGDLISGDIHEELRITNALTSHEQCIAVAEELSAGIVCLKETFGRVHIVVVPGNHGRTTHKPTAKLYARLSYDNLIGAMIAEKFRNDERITFQQSAAKDQLTPVFGRTVLTTHGDKIGTKGGMGFAGPMLPIVRGAKKIDAQQAGIGRKPDLIQFGHYHTTGNPGLVLANGSVPGYSEYGDDLRAVVEPPQQWAYLLHSKWWLRERMPIQLEDPRMPEKPRIKVPAGWSA
jgi:hypothetical protein